MRLITFILLFFSLKSFSQITACFTIDNESGCVPHTINVTDCSGHIGPQYFYGDEPVTTNTSFTFSEAGTYSVIQAVDNGGVFNFDTQFVTVFPIPIPIVEVTNCGNNKVYLECENMGYDQYIVDWGDGNIDSFNAFPSLEHQYPNNNNRTINISGNYQPENCGNDTTITITPFLNFTKANIDTLEVLDASQIKLLTSGQEQVIYQFSGASTNQIISENTSFVDTVSSLNTLTNVYCFEVKALNKCNALAPVANTKSDNVCSIILDGISQPGYNQINWDSYTGDNTPSYNLFRNQSLLQNFNVNQNPYNDSSIFCSQEYDYKLYTNAGNSTSISNEISIIGKSESSPNPVTNVFSTYNLNNELEISWKSATRIPPLYYSVNSTQVTDTFLVSNTIKQDCYEITFTDSCGNTSLVSEKTCPIVLEVKQNSIFELELNWNDYQTFEKGISNYFIEVYDKSKSLITTIENSTSTNLLYDVSQDENQIYFFRIKGFSNDSISTFSNEVEIKLNNRIMMPNAFTPNGDGDNDIFIPKLRFVKDYKFAIYNKWGANLFLTTDKNEGWNGEGFPPGVYSYYVEATDYLGETIIKKGTVTLIK